MPHLHHASSGTSWTAVLLTLVLLFAALVYLRGWFRLRSTSTSIRLWRAVSLVSGLLLIWIAIASPLAALDHELLTVHMIQHLLLMTLAPPLIWLGAPVMALAHGLPRQYVQRVLGPTFCWPPLQRLSRTLTRLTFTLLAATAALVVWHIPAAFMLGLQSPAWHIVEHASFLVTGLLFWWPVIQPWPSAPRQDLSIILYLFFATLPCDILAGFLVFCDRVVYPVYFSSSQPFGFSALADQQCAAALMWTCVTVVYLVAGAILTMRLLSTSHHNHELMQSQPNSSVSPTAAQRLEVA